MPPCGCTVAWSRQRHTCVPAVRIVVSTHAPYIVITIPFGCTLRRATCVPLCVALVLFLAYGRTNGRSGSRTLHSRPQSPQISKLRCCTLSHHTAEPSATPHLMLRPHRWRDASQGMLVACTVPCVASPVTKVKILEVTVHCVHKPHATSRTPQAARRKVQGMPTSGRLARGGPP